MEISKECTKCHELKPLGDFNRQKSTRDGRKTECKKCAAARNEKIYKNKTPIEKAIYIDDVKNWQQDNPEKFKGYLQKYRKSNN